MKVNNENFDKVLNKLVASTRSPRGRFTAENSWKLLESRLLKRRSMKRFWMRTASAAAVVLLCVTSWAAYQFLYVAPQREAIPTEAVHTTEETQVIHSVLTFDQQPLQEIVRQLSETFRTDIRIEGDSLKNYHMTATFREGESLTEILDLLKEAGNFTYKKKTTPLSLLLNLTDNDQLYYLFAPPHQNRTSDVCGSFKLLTPCTSTKQGNTYKPEYP